ncbi:2'-5' RNA ligase family protein [Cryobacterium sp. TMT1-66-1]|uniref:2'-5' RNA ligase family protein n=1 Tax=Cryobacterium sp. TMT1-66-1 TaxID=1259242 RepID=UPI00106C57CF|nr:2'-5' RNA ligase family protein [Cryobacterium sp. TMT1-66-1]TFD09390.1 2'-5' RNA ligase family protein [Cryobacterium sp. TMT1-66-1]
MTHLVIVAPLEALTVGDSFPVSRFPLHLTVLPPFLVNIDLAALWQVVAAVSESTEPLLAEVTGQGGFGANGEIAVGLIRPIASLLEAHSRLTEALMPLGWVAKEPQYSGEGYRPHITGNNERAVRSGEVFILQELAIVEMLTQPIIRANFRLLG